MAPWCKFALRYSNAVLILISIYYCVYALFFFIKQFCYTWTKYEVHYVSLNLKVKLYGDFPDTAHRKKLIVLYVMYIYIYIYIYIYKIKIYKFCFNVFSTSVLNA